MSKTTDRFLRFLEERIDTASSIATKSAYIVVKEQFKLLFEYDISVLDRYSNVNVEEDTGALRGNCKWCNTDDVLIHEHKCPPSKHT
jgi:hypothetical protein